MATKTAISFSLVHIPISMNTAQQDNDIHFNQLHAEDHSRVKYMKTCAHCGKELGASDIVRGYEYDKGKFVIITDEDIESVKSENDRTMKIKYCTRLDSISPVYFDKMYHAVPDAGSEAAYELLRQALMNLQVVAIARVVLGTKDTQIALIPREDGILCQTMFFEEEVKNLPKYTRPAVDPEQLKMAETIIGSMVRDFDPNLMHDEHQQKLKDLISAKIAGKEVVTEAMTNPWTNVIDLQEALTRSLEQPKKEAKPKKRGKRGA